MGRLNVLTAGPLVTIQDAGRPGQMRYGVPRSGPMDRVAHAAANVAVGNPPDAPAIEVSLGGVTVEVLDQPLTLATTGGAFTVARNGRPVPHWRVHTLMPGDILAVQAGTSGSWATIAVAGRLDTPTWLGHAATHSPSGFGGGTLTAGATVTVIDGRIDRHRDGPIPTPTVDITGPIRVVLGPQDHLFPAEAVTRLIDSAWVATVHANRMGIRLDGPTLTPDDALSVASQPITRGCVQVDGSGAPTLLLADHQTTGGYPKIATVITADLDRIGQLRAGNTVRFAAVEPAEAVAVTRAHVQSGDSYLRAVADRPASLEARLLTQNLIDGVLALPHLPAAGSN